MTHNTQQSCHHPPREQHMAWVRRGAPHGGGTWSRWRRGTWSACPRKELTRRPLSRPWPGAPGPGSPALSSSPPAACTHAREAVNIACTAAALSSACVPTTWNGPQKDGDGLEERLEHRVEDQLVLVLRAGHVEHEVAQVLVDDDNIVEHDDLGCVTQIPRRKMSDPTRTDRAQKGSPSCRAFILLVLFHSDFSKLDCVGTVGLEF